MVWKDQPKNVIAV